MAITLSTDAEKVDIMQGRIAIRSLSKLGVNQPIDVPVQKLSNKFGGLGMIELNSKSLGDRLHHLRRSLGT